MKKKEHNTAGLQLSDLLVYPAKRQMLHEIGLGPAPAGFTKTLADHLDQGNKYNRQIYDGRIWGYGKILLR